MLIAQKSLTPKESQMKEKLSTFTNSFPAPHKIPNNSSKLSLLDLHGYMQESLKSYPHRRSHIYLQLDQRDLN